MFTIPRIRKCASRKVIEKIEVLSRNGTNTGKVKSRDEIHRNGDWHHIIHCWIVNQRGELLIQKRSMNKESYAGLWDVSCAGHIIFGDSSRETALKELKEELGMGNVMEDELQMIMEKIPLSAVHETKNGKEKYIDNELTDVYLLERMSMLDCNGLELQEEEVFMAHFIHYEKYEHLQSIGDQRLVPLPCQYRNHLYSILKQRNYPSLSSSPDLDLSFLDYKE